MVTRTIHLTNIFVFFLTYFVVTICMVFYDAIKPSYTREKFNWVPFPTISPGNIPDANVRQKAFCLTSPQECTADQDCSQCGSDEFQCTAVAPGERVSIGSTEVEGGKSWCLPTGKNQAGCGLYTGRAVWAFDPNTGEQQWDCVCLYPNLYGGKTCNQQLACIDTSIATDQSQNKLVDEATGRVWDPQDPDADILDSPYARNPDGSPKYTCRCDQNKGELGKKQFVRLPGDPQRCHVDPCSVDEDQALFDATSQRCECPQDGSEPGRSPFARSNITGKCLPVANSCSPSALWNTETNECVCPSGYVNQTCPSKTYERDTYTQETRCDTKVGGSFCDPICRANTCQRNAPCLVKATAGGDTSVTDNTYPDADYYCDCSKADGAGGDVSITGQNCETSCLVDGTDITDQTPGSDNSLGCCSKTSYQQVNTQNPGRSKEFCGDQPSACTIL